MGQNTDQIERHIEKQRLELDDNINDLRKKVKDTFDWRVQFEHHPMAMVGAAVGGGLLLSALFGRPRSAPVQGEPWQPETSASGSGSYDDKARHGRYPKRPESKSLRDIKIALASVAAERFGGLLDSVLPGFAREYHKVRSDGGSPNAER